MNVEAGQAEEAPLAGTATSQRQGSQIWAIVRVLLKSAGNLPSALYFFLFFIILSLYLVMRRMVQYFHIFKSKMQESVVKPEQAIEELIIRIDENNKIIGSTTRKEMVI